MTYPGELIAAARKIMGGESSRAERNRAVSTAYYAIFHCLCEHFAEIANTGGPRGLHRARQQAYRSLDHVQVRTRCREISNSRFDFPGALVKVAGDFLALQERRNEADYDPYSDFSADAATTLIGDAERAIALFESAPVEDQRAFVIFVATKPRR